MDGDVAPFGVLVETDDDVVVLTADTVHEIGVEPVRWKTCHREVNYPNQVHVIGDDRLRIVSFVNEDRRDWGSRQGFGHVG